MNKASVHIGGNKDATHLHSVIAESVGAVALARGVPRRKQRHAKAADIGQQVRRVCQDGQAAGKPLITMSSLSRCRCIRSMRSLTDFLRQSGSAPVGQEAATQLHK